MDDVWQQTDEVLVAVPPPRWKRHPNDHQLRW